MPKTPPRRVILVSGATSDIGMSIIEQFVNEGFEIVALVRDSDIFYRKLSEAAHSKCHAYKFDARNLNDIPELLNRIINEQGKVQHFVHCLGMHAIKPLKLASSEHLAENFNLNCSSGLLIAKYFSQSKYSEPAFDQVEVGQSIVFICSLAATRPEAGLMAYSASKAALVVGAQSIALELAHKNIRVNCISPGWVSSARSGKVSEKLGPIKIMEHRAKYPLGFGRVEDVAKLCSFLVSSSSRWITGQNIVIDGGRSLV
ncbi:SDR family NAD(P)-dependent oxidoreductase [Terasakiella pusilla]|uniref:SDR family NAD(P)-dependent oxidoreductase n=1 Tax=Terasakiella pusilla TaxID=64973 RepID=UPI003AA8FACA